MSINLLAISVGNTRTRIGTFQDDELLDTGIVEHQNIIALTNELEEAFRPLRDREDSVAMLSSVNPLVSERVASLVVDKLDVPLLQIERDISIPVGRQLDPEAIVGEDRLLNAAAAYHRLKEACIIVDIGTAMTVDFIDGAGTFHGGAIAPGVRMMLRSLHEHTAQLPDVEFARPVDPMGHNTAEAMRSGVFYCLRGMMRELVEQYAEKVGFFPTVVATGGDAENILINHELVDRMTPDLTLWGMLTTLRMARETK